MSSVGVFSPETCFMSPHVIRDCARCEFYPTCIKELENETGIHRIQYDDGNGSYLEEPIEIILRKQEMKLGKEKATLLLMQMYPTMMDVLLAFNRNPQLTARDLEDMGIARRPNVYKIFNKLFRMGYIHLVPEVLEVGKREYWMLRI